MSLHFLIICKIRNISTEALHFTCVFVTFWDQFSHLDSVSLQPSWSLHPDFVMIEVMHYSHYLNDSWGHIAHSWLTFGV